MYLKSEKKIPEKEKKVEKEKGMAMGKYKREQDWQNIETCRKLSSFKTLKQRRCIETCIGSSIVYSKK